MDHLTCNAADGQSRVQEFYKDTKVLITGGTGFIGKALTEKLLRTCLSVSTIYLVIRPKKGQCMEQRLKAILSERVFDRIREDKDSEKLFSKVVGMEGDLGEANMGLSIENLNRLQDDVTIVFHSAATVKLRESLRTVVALNVIGTQRILQISQKMKQLKVFMHVSTAYANVNNEPDVLEKVYPVPGNILEEIKSGNELSVEYLENIGRQMQRPNTYSIAKAIAESVVAAYAQEIPNLAIVRPSIVTAAWREPTEGWVDNVNGANGVVMELSLGKLRSIIAKKHIVLDIIPSDIVVNMILVAAWYTVTFRSAQMKVYHCTSGPTNPLTIGELFEKTQRYSLEAPSKFIQWYPGAVCRTNWWVHSFCDFTLHFVPALLADIYRRLTGSKPIYLRLYYLMKFALKSFEHYTLGQWNFADKNAQSLRRAIQNTQDEELFNIDVSRLDWDTYVKNFLYGIRKFVLRDSEETISNSRRKLQRYYWVHIVSQVILVVFLVHLTHMIIRKILDI